MATFIESRAEAVWAVGVLESVAVTVNVVRPGAVGVPLIAPVLGVEAQPGGQGAGGHRPAHRANPTRGGQRRRVRAGHLPCGSEVVVTANPMAPVISTELGVYASVYGSDPKA